MKILLGHNYYRSSSPSGEDTAFRNECKLLLDQGVDIVRFERHNDLLKEATFLDRLSLGADTIWCRRTYRDLRRILSTEKPDIAHFHNTFPQISPSAYMACHDVGVPVVQTLHNFRLICADATLTRNGQPCELCVGTNLLPALRFKCYRNSLTATAALVGMLGWNRLRNTYNYYVDRYVALTHFAARKLASGGIPAERITVKPNILPDPPDPGTGDGGYVVFVGRLSREKGICRLLEAWRSLSDLPLVIVGDGPLRALVEEKARTNHLPINCLGLQQKAAVARVIGQAALLVLPSECYESLPMVILEAFAVGTPVVVSELGGLPELVADGVTGFTFKPGDSEDLARCVRAAFSDQARLKIMRQLTRQHYLDVYSPKANFQTLLSVYHDAHINFAAGPSQAPRRNESIHA